MHVEHGHRDDLSGHSNALPIVNHNNESVTMTSNFPQKNQTTDAVSTNTDCEEQHGSSCHSEAMVTSYILPESTPELTSNTGSTDTVSTAAGYEVEQESSLAGHSDVLTTLNHDSQLVMTTANVQPTNRARTSTSTTDTGPATADYDVTKILHFQPELSASNVSTNPISTTAEYDDEFMPPAAHKHQVSVCDLFYFIH